MRLVFFCDHFYQVSFQYKGMLEQDITNRTLSLRVPGLDAPRMLKGSLALKNKLFSLRSARRRIIINDTSDGACLDGDGWRATLSRNARIRTRCTFLLATASRRFGRLDGASEFFCS